jgi:hypothetical protein
MTDAYREDWDITSEEGSLCFASAIYSRLVGGEQDEATLQWLAKYLRANAPPRHHTAMTDQHYDLMPAMNDQLRTRVEALEARYETQCQATLEWSKNVARWIMELEAGQKTKPSPAVDRVRDLQDQIRDGSLTLAEALKEIDGAPDPTVRTMLPSGLPATSDPITRRLWQPLRTEITYGEANAHAQDLVRHLSMDHLNYPEIPDSSPAPTDSLVERVARRLTYEHDISPNWEDEARIAIREVAAWILEQAPAPGPLVKWLGGVSTPFEVMADMLRSEANQ